jgi:hypothetical protein
MKIQIDDKLDPTKPRPVKIPRPGYAFRDNDRIQFDSPEFASMVWNKCGLRDRWKELWEHPKYGLETTQGQSIVSLFFWILDFVNIHKFGAQQRRPK